MSLPGGTTVGAAAPAAAPAASPSRGGRLAARLGTGRRPGSGRTSGLTAALWLGPALVLIAGVVLYPAVELLRASFSDYSITGLRRGSAGTANYTRVLEHPALVTVLVNTVVWVVAVLVLSLVIGLGLAQLMSKNFAGRRLMRWAIIVPWAASLVITARLFMLILDYNYGILNRALLALGVVDTPVDFLGDDRLTLPSMIGVGVFVTLPFTAYVLLAGLNAIPSDVYEAARVDGARPWQAYRAITLPLLRPALLVATVLNIIYVFNSFPIVYTLNDRNPGFAHDTTITFMYKLAFKSAEKSVGMSAAAGIFNVLLILAVVLVYLRIINWKEATE